MATGEPTPANRAVPSVGIRRAAEVYAPFVPDERLRLQRFLSQMETLRHSSFLAYPGHRMKATFVSGYAQDVHADSPGEEAVRAVMLPFRQLYVGTNETSALSVLNILKRSARRRGTVSSREALAELASLRRAIQDRRARDPRAVMLEESRGPRTPAEIIDLWFNGEYFHFDQDKAAVLEDIPLAVEMMRFMLHSAIRDFATLFEHVAARAEAALAAEPAD